MVPNVCLGETYKQSYDLLDNPDGSINYRLTVSINQTLIEYYNNQNLYLYSYDFSKFVTPETVKPIADDLWTIYDNPEDFANGVLMMVHQIAYLESDPQKYPVETISENIGDCDLFSVLAASIMKAGGLDVVLLLLEPYDHMWVGVHLHESPKYARSQVYFYRYDGRKYYVAETTGGNWEIGWRVGECPEILQRAAAKVIPISNYEKSSPGQVSSSYVLPDSAVIQMSLSTNFLVSQNGVEMRGSLSPSLAGEQVELYVNSFNSPLVKLATVQTDNEGSYTYFWDSPPGGIYSIRANWSGDEDYNGADSNVDSLVVFPSEFLYVGVLLVFFLTILLIVILETRSKSKNKDGFENWDYSDYPTNC